MFVLYVYNFSYIKISSIDVTLKESNQKSAFQNFIAIELPGMIDISEHKRVNFVICDIMIEMQIVNEQ